MAEVQFDPYREKILWSSISRNGTILAEAGEDPFDGAVSQAAHGILAKKPTPGWEYFTLKNGEGWFGRKSSFSGKSSNSKDTAASATTTSPTSVESPPRSTVRIPRLKAVKFHVYEHSVDHNDEDDDLDSSNNKSPAAAAADRQRLQRSTSSAAAEPIIWVFAAVYNPEATSWTNSKHILSDVQSFLEKIVGLTAMPRSSDPAWRNGGTLACQATFASILLQRMQEVTYLGTMARLTESLEGATELMQNNITAIMQREEQLSSMHDKSSQLNEMASVFKKKTSGVRRRMMMQNAKHGIILGTAITAGVAVCVVPPLIAIL
ncbi:hypothetical protein ACA910_016368 [Epithemia clementina (nom. ined.)]